MVEGPIEPSPVKHACPGELTLLGGSVVMACNNCSSLEWTVLEIRSQEDLAKVLEQVNLSEVQAPCENFSVLNEIGADRNCTAYLLMPRLWYQHEHQLGLAAKSAVTTTPSGIPGDLLNVGLVGDKADVILSMHKAGWYAADPVTLKSSIEIAGSVVFDRPYAEAPVSTLIYDGRKQDLAFEKPAGESADRRNHVRFWMVIEKGVEGRPVWLGSATLDHSVGLNHG